MLSTPNNVEGGSRRLFPVTFAISGEAITRPPRALGLQRQKGNVRDRTHQEHLLLQFALFKDPMRCGICGSTIHLNSISIDHIERKQDGGMGVVENAQLSHPFCNTDVKH
jgi:hypothetical protein